MVDLATRALGWDVDDATAGHFVWKHFANPFGPSALWVAVADGRVIGLRCLLRWELVTPDGHVLRVARAVDTGTDPAHQRQGVFTRLTTAALDALTDEGVAFVFNTPNAQSRPANLTLGWQVVGRLPAAVRPSGARGLVALLRARTPATRGALPCPAGESAAAVFDDRARAEALLGGGRPASGLATHRTPEYLAWRYGHADLHYRVVGDPDAAVVFHLRRRGRATEAVVCDAFGGDARRLTRLHRRIGRETGADYLLALGSRGFLPVPGQGPILAARTVTQPPPTGRRAWSLTLGDIEGL